MTRDSEITPLSAEPSHETVNSSWLENSTKGSNNFNTIAMPSTSSPIEVDANGVASPSSIADTIQADELDESLEQIEISKKEIDQAVQGPHSPSNNSILLSNKKLLKIPCEPDKLPFSIKGGADNAELFHVDTVLHPDILDKLSAGDILLSVNKTEISGMIQKEVLLMLKSVYSAQEFITIEYIPAGKLSTDILKILRDKNYMDLQSVIRDNIYRDMVPITTRPPKPGEVEGENYHFVTDEAFAQLVKDDLLLEFGKFQGFSYGTPKPGILFEEEIMVNTDTLGPLPPNWEIAYSEMGEKYYIDHNSGSTQWEDPREQLPEGWERVHDEKYGVFYVDHVNKRTQYEPPIAATSSHQYSSVAPPGAYTPHVVKAGTSSSAYGSYVHANGRIPNTVASSSNGWQPTATQTVQNGYSHQYIGGPTKIQPTPLTNGGTSIVHRAPPNSVGEASKMAVEKNRSSASYVFTRDPAQLRGELITTRIEKGPKGLGFTLIGNDAGSTRPEFIQIKTIINNGPAALDNVLHTGDVLVYVNNILMLGATQDDACQVFRQIKVGEIVTIQVCRGYPLLLDPTKMIITENVYAPPSSQQRPFGDPTATHFHQRNKEILEIQIRKGSKGFGFTITDSLQGQRVKTVRYPEQCQNLLEGDVILEVDGRNVRNIPHAELVQLLHDCPIGFQTRMLVSRNSPRHRSRTPTAAFRFGEQRATPVPVLAPRSKTPAPGPTRPTKTGSVRQYQPRNTTMPRSTHQREDLYENVSKIRSSSTTLGFSSTPNYVPISAFAYDKPSGHQLITVNLIRKPDGFGFRLVGGEEMGTPLTVGAIIEGGAAHVDGRLREHDEIVEIDGRNAEHGKHTEAVELIKKAAHIGHVKLVVRRLRDDIPRSTSMPFSAYNYGDLATSLPPTHQSNGGYNPKTPFDVHLAKLEHEDFGCTIVSLNNRYIGKIIPDSPADRCGRLKPGDCVIAINGLPLDDMSHQQVINYIKSSGNTITFTIDHSKAHPSFVSDTNGHAGLPNGRTTPSQLYSYPPASTSSIPRYDTVPSSRSNDHLYHNGFGPENGNNETLIHFELPRGAKGFGFSIRGGWEFGQMPLLVLRVAEDGPAAAAGIQVGDQIFEINGENTDGMTHDRAIQLIKEHPTVRLVIRRPQN